LTAILAGCGGSSDGPFAGVGTSFNRETSVETLAPAGPTVRLTLNRDAGLSSLNAIGAATGRFAVDIWFSEAVEGFTRADVTVTNGRLDTRFGDFGNGIRYRVFIVPTGGRVTVNIAADVATAVSGGAGNAATRLTVRTQRRRLEEAGPLPPEDRETIFDLFEESDDPNTTVAVNLYLWQAALEILDFMPVEVADPFSGIIAFGYGVPPGGARAYRATVHVQDPALEARALRVAVQSRDGAVARADARRIEDAILTRARQLRIRDASL